MPERGERTALYRLYDADDRLLYVGVTRDVDRRLAAHRNDKPWWPQVARRSVEWFDERGDAAKAETQAIRSETPAYNIVDYSAPPLISNMGGKPLDTTADDWVAFAEIARRVVHLGLVRSMTGSGVRHIATTHPEWPIPQEEWRYIANSWALSWAPVERFFREVYVEKKRGSDRTPRRRPRS
jgi:predicted GIY-YIG superfamily endonuclease